MPGHEGWTFKTLLFVVSTTMKLNWWEFFPTDGQASDRTEKEQMYKEQREGHLEQKQAGRAEKCHQSFSVWLSFVLEKIRTIPLFKFIIPNGETQSVL